MLLGSVSFVAVCLLPLALPEAKMARTGWLLLVYALEGVGRAVFEGINKAVYADFFGERGVEATGSEVSSPASAAFAATIVEVGGSGAAAFFLMMAYRGPNPWPVAAAGLVFALLSVPGYLLARRLNRAMVQQRSRLRSVESSFFA
jgi:uncharacterized membrane protein YbhN (UPF0104 family)